MFERPLHQLVSALHLKGWTTTTEDYLHGSITSYEFESGTEFAVPGIVSNLDLLISKERANSIYLLAINGDLESMSIVSLMYMSGYGMPLDLEVGLAWSNFAVMQAADTYTYEQLVLRLKQDRAQLFKETRGDFVKPESVRKLEEQLLYITKPQRLKRTRIPVTANFIPVVAGKRVAAVYRVAKGKKPSLYAAYDVSKETLDFDKDLWQALKCPYTFGDIRERNILESYAPFGKVKYYIVLGTVTTPKDKLEDREKVFPGQTVNKLYQKALAKDQLPPVTEEEIKERLATLIEKKKEELNLIKKNNGCRKKYSEIMAQAKRLRSASRDREYVKRKAIEQSAPTRLSTYLTFVAAELFTYCKGEVRAVPLNGMQEQQHLQSLGFYTLLNEVITEKEIRKNLKLSETGAEIEYANILDTLERLTHNSRFVIKGFYVRPKGITVKRPYYVMK